MWNLLLRIQLSYVIVHHTLRKELENATANENHIKTIIKPNISAQILEIILKQVKKLFITLNNNYIEIVSI